MKVPWALLPYTAVTLILLGCSDIGGPDSRLPPPIAPAGDTYSYTAYDSTGTPVTRGWLTLIRDGYSVSGEWHLQAIGSPKNIGPQIGDGNLRGEIRNGNLIVELQPNFRDNNIGLIGTLSGATYAGVWTWISFIGPTNQGTFVAKHF